MFSAIATVAAIGWVINHKVETCIILAVIIFLVYRLATYNTRQARKAQAAARERAKAKAAQSALVKAVAPPPTPSAPSTPSAPVPVSAPSASTLTVVVPAEINGMTIAYHYDDVQLVNPTANITSVPEGSELDFDDSGSRIRVLYKGTIIGYLPDNRLSGMVRDWQREGNPIRSYLSSGSGSRPYIFLAFYDDVLKKFLSRNPDAKQFKLAGKPDDFASCTVGQKCEIEHDPESDKYNVLVDGLIIGRLPAAAITYADKLESDPDMLDAVVASVDYDIEKDHNVISVYLA